MESKVKVVEEEHGDFQWEINKDKTEFTLLKDAKITLTLNDGKKYTFSFKKDFKCDGLSVPSYLQWFLPRWIDKNMLYNLAGVVHDSLYASKGYKVFTRDDSDAIFRGLLRMAGCNRFHASMADFMLGIFAKSHWGQDDLNSAKYVICEEI